MKGSDQAHASLVTAERSGNSANCSYYGAKPERRSTGSAQTGTG
jgi:hypothetical protein